MSLHPVARADSIWPGEMISVRAGGFRVVLVNVEGALVAYEDRCLHKGVPLSEGRFTGDKLVCRVHGWEYRARTGEGINPCHVRLRSFPVVVHDGLISIEVEDP